ncbi:hypothetical protein Pmani_009879 [Petrolisthes manimaculis]|uniref:Uncharacterized protein n=1 Tax=Petrolisthes manimaculis TaxID=1843537 RepID=A0AAE1UHB0_9EUCA|nr:hypothetical protein Pmani_009879 [Petrolisthes manimaculis]
MLCRRLVLLLVCVCCLVVATHSAGLLLGLAALKGAILGKKILHHKGGFSGGHHHGYVSHGSYHTPHYPPQYQTSHVHYHTGHIPHYHHFQGGHDVGYSQGWPQKGLYFNKGGLLGKGHLHYSHQGWPQKGHSVYRRSVKEEEQKKGEMVADEGENLLLTTATQLDQDGCILKLVCSLQTTPEEARSSNEAVLASIFTEESDSSSSSSSYSAAFVHAAGVGRQAQDSTPCNKVFSKCLMEEEDMRRALDKAWGCADWNEL